ncbi:MAG TPA: DUF4340 domain-containing protein [Anaeromyxobacteraceae bacterium]
MRSKRRTLLSTLLLAALAAGAVAFAWFGVEKRDEAAERKKVADEKLYAFSPAKVKTVTVEAKGATTRLARARTGDVDGWRVEAPVQADAERAAVDALVDKVAELRRKAAVSAVPDDAALARYGLARPRAKVALALEDGRVETLALGDENPFDGTVFVRTTGGAVELVPGDVRWSVERGTFDLRDKTVLRFDREQVATLRFRMGATTFEATRDGTPTRLPGVLWTLSSLRATAFADESGRSIAAHGLDHPAREVALLGKDGKELDRLLVSPERGGKTFAKAASSPCIVELDPGSLASLPRSAGDLKETPPPNPQAKTAPN